MRFSTSTHGPFFGASGFLVGGEPGRADFQSLSAGGRLVILVGVADALGFWSGTSPQMRTPGTGISSSVSPTATARIFCGLYDPRRTIHAGFVRSRVPEVEHPGPFQTVQNRVAACA
jgi:hypothetical protein